MISLHKLLYKLRLFYWKIFKPITVGVRILLIKEGRVVLVRHTYQDYWYIPGGGIKKSETIEQAIKREIKEELNGKIHSMELFGVYSNFFENKNDHIIVFLSQDFTINKKVSNEIEATKTCSLNNLPDNISSGSKRRINEFTAMKRRNFGEW